MVRTWLLCVLLVALLAPALPEAAVLVREHLQLEPARTRVGIARVLLEIDDLRVDDSRLVGTYEIKIPLLPSRDDRGHVEIALSAPLDRVISQRGVLTGRGHSVLDGRTHAITCEFVTDDTVEILVDTGDRLLTFKTRFQ